MHNYEQEGNAPVYMSLYGAASYVFFEVLKEIFFEQGLGNRVLWIDEPMTLTEFDRDFVFPDGEDAELQGVKEQLFEDLRYIERNSRLIMLRSDALDIWEVWANKLKRNIFGQTYSREETEYRAKQIQNSIKLATIYAASRFSLDPDTQIVLITDTDIKQAIADCETFVNMWKSLMIKWKSGAFLPRRIVFLVSRSNLTIS